MGRRLLIAAALVLTGCGARGTLDTVVVARAAITPEPVATPAPRPVPVATAPAPPPAPARPAVSRPVVPRPVVVRTPRPVPTPVVPIGRIQIQRIGLDHAVFEGDDLPTVDHGPGHRPSSARPGQTGNAVFAGHRVTHTRPFYDIDLLQPGDHIVFVMPDGAYTYEMTEHWIVSPNDMWVTYPTPDAVVTLYACHPKHSAKQRYVVRARLLEGQGVGG